MSYPAGTYALRVERFQKCVKLEPGGRIGVHKSAEYWMFVGKGLGQISDRWINAPAETHAGAIRNKSSRRYLSHELLNT